MSIWKARRTTEVTSQAKGTSAAVRKVPCNIFVGRPEASANLQGARFLEREERLGCIAWLNKTRKRSHGEP